MSRSRPQSGCLALARSLITTVLVLAAPCAWPQSQAADVRSPTLADLLTSLLPIEPQVRLAQAQSNIAQQRCVQARSRLGPNVFAEARHGHGQDLEYGIPVARRHDRAEGGVRWNLYNGGADLAEWRACTSDQQATQEEVRRAREESADKLVELYLQLLRVQNLMPLARARLAMAQQWSGQVRQQVEAGKASPTDATQIGVMVLDAQIALDQLALDGESAREKLQVLVGEAVPAVAPLALASVDAREDMLSGTPGAVAAATLRAQAARDRVLSETSLMTPRIDLELVKQLGDHTLPQVSTTSARAWRLTARWEIPVMGESAARRQESVHRAEAAEADAQRLSRGTQAELRTLPARIAQAERALLQMDLQVQQYRALVEAGQVQFESGRRTLTQLVQLRDSQFAAEQRREDLTQRLLADRLRLLSLQGRLLAHLGVPL